MLIYEISPSFGLFWLIIEFKKKLLNECECILMQYKLKKICLVLVVQLLLFAAKCTKNVQLFLWKSSAWLVL